MERFTNAGCFLTLLLIVEDRPKLIGIMEVILFHMFMGDAGLTSFLGILEGLPEADVGGTTGVSQGGERQAGERQSKGVSMTQQESPPARWRPSFAIAAL